MTQINSKASNNSIEHDVNDKELNEMAREYDMLRLSLKFWQRMEDKLKDQVKQTLEEESGGEVGFKTDAGIFKFSISEQRRSSDSLAKEICYDMDLEPSLFEKPIKRDVLGPFSDDGRLTYVRYMQMENYIRAQNKDYDNLVTAIEESDDKVSALEVCWSFRKIFSDKCEMAKDVLKDKVLEYTEKEGGYNPQVENHRLMMNDNLSFYHTESAQFSSKKFFEYLEGMYYAEEPNEEKIKKIEEVSNKRMTQDAQKRSFPFILKEAVGQLEPDTLKEANKIYSSDKPHEVYQYLIDNVDNTDITDKLKNFVKSESERMIEDKNPIEFLKESIKQTSTIVKFDPPRNKIHNERDSLLAQAHEIYESIEDISLSADIDTSKYLSERLQATLEAGIDFPTHKHVYRENVPDLDGPESMAPKKTPRLSLDM